MYNLSRKFNFVNDFFENNDFFQNFVHVETNAPLELEVDVAGIAVNDISVQLEGGTLVIKGETDGRKFLETHLVPRNVDTEKIEVQYLHGLLRITAPTINKKIDIKIQSKE